MSESLHNNNLEQGSEEPFVLNVGLVIEALLQWNESLDDVECRIDLESDDLEDLIGADENEFLGNLATLATMHDIDHEDVFRILDIDAEFTKPTTNEAMLEFLKNAFRAMMRQIN